MSVETMSGLKTDRCILMKAATKLYTEGRGLHISRPDDELKHNISINAEYGNVDQHENRQWSVRSCTRAMQPKVQIVYTNRNYPRPRALKR